MLVKDILQPANVLIEDKQFDKASLLRDLSDRAATAVGLEPELVLAEVMKRENLGSTGLGQGIAIPHTRLADLEQTFSLLVRLVHPVNFDATDGEPVDIVFFLLLPHSQAQAQLNSLACVARSLRDPAIQSDLRKAADETELYRAVTKLPVSQS